jgi:ribose transport system substrate-binding protein
MRSLVLLLSVTLLTTACKQSGKPVIGVVPKGASHIFWQTVHAGAIKAAQEDGFEVEWNAPTREVDASRQIEIVESMVNRKLAGIVLAPVDRKALVATVERAAAAGIPVSIFDSAIDTPKRITYVATNNEEGGRMAARRMGEVLQGKGKVGVIGFMPGSASTMEREHGFQDEIRTKFPGINLIGLQFAMADRAKAMAQTENILASHPDLAGLFADNESSSAGAIQALKARNAKSVRMVAFDASEQLLAELRAGWIDSIVVQNPFRMGYEATKSIAQHRNKQPLPAVIDSGAQLILAADLDNANIKELLFPDIRKYLTPTGH